MKKLILFNILLVFGINYAYFLAQDQSNVQTITTQNIGVDYADNEGSLVKANKVKPVARDDILTDAIKKHLQ